MLWSNIVKRTPVDTGRARANWNVSKGQVDPSTTENTQASVTLSKVPVAEESEDYYISNNLSYIKTLEYGGYPNPPKRGSYDKKKKRWVKKSANGFSKQAPNGMVGVTMADAQNLFNEALKFK